MASITAIVHTKNSEQTLKQCLDSLAFCDEIFVVDMESTDTTLAIAKKTKAKIYTVRQPDGEPLIVEKVRQQFIEKVKTDWTLIVDSDEEVPESLAKKIQEAMLVQSVDAYKIPRRNIILGKEIEHTGYWPDYLLRLFRTGVVTHPTEIHIQPEVKGKLMLFPALKEYGLIHHHYASIESFLTRLNKYTSFEVEKLLKAKEAYNPLEAVVAFFQQFHTRYFQQQGYKDGTFGFVLSLLQSIYPMISILKAWEKTKTEVDIRFDDVESVIADGCRSTSYWVANEQLPRTRNIMSRVSLLLRRKLAS